MRNRKLHANGCVLIVTPHRRDHEIDVRAPEFVMKAMIRQIADWYRVPSNMPDPARNRAIDEFKNNPAYARKTHLMFVDADSPPMNEFAIERLLSLNKDVVAGVTPIILQKSGSFSCFWSCCLKDEEGKFQNIGIDELPRQPFRAERTGGTCLLLSRRVLDKLEPPYQVTEWNEDYTDVERSEDYYFADKIRKAGFDIWIDPTTVCSHYHKFNILDLFNVYNQMKERVG